MAVAVLCVIDRSRLSESVVVLDTPDELPKEVDWLVEEPGVASEASDVPDGSSQR